jgi:hypothetical protein
VLLVILIVISAWLRRAVVLLSSASAWQPSPET